MRVPRYNSVKLSTGHYDSRWTSGARGREGGRGGREPGGRLPGWMCVSLHPQRPRPGGLIATIKRRHSPHSAVYRAVDAARQRPQVTARNHHFRVHHSTPMGKRPSSGSGSAQSEPLLGRNVSDAEAGCAAGEERPGGVPADCLIAGTGLPRMCLHPLPPTTAARGSEAQDGAGAGGPGATRAIPPSRDLPLPSRDCHCLCRDSSSPLATLPLLPALLVAVALAQQTA